MPEPGSVNKFKNFKYMLFVPVVIYADFECYQSDEHRPSGYGIFVQTIDDKIYESKYISNTFDGDVAKEFLEQILKICDEINSIPKKDME